MSSRAVLRLKTALRRFSHTAALNDGAIAIDGVSLDFVDVRPSIAAYRRMVRDLEFDLCEMAPTTYFIARAHGAPFTALPIFLTRRFHHSGLVVGTESGIQLPGDLAGKKVGVRAYSVTTGVWTRGILANEYGLDASQVTWVVDDEEHVTALRLPPNVVQVPLGQSLVSMMASGEIDAAFTGNAGIGREGAPLPGWEAQSRPGRDAGYRELFADAARLEADWWRRTGIYPFHGVMVIKDEILKAHPFVARALYDAFVEAKRQWLPTLTRGDHGSADDRIYRDFMPLVGNDPLPYGIENNIKSIDALVDYSVQQGLMPQRLPLQRLFFDPEAE